MPNNRPRLRRLAQAAMAKRWPAVVAITTLLLPALYAAGQLNLDIRAIRFLAPDSPTRQMAEMMDARMGGINIVQLDFDTGKPNGINHTVLDRWDDFVMQQLKQPTFNLIILYSISNRFETHRHCFTDQCRVGPIQYSNFPQTVRPDIIRTSDFLMVNKVLPPGGRLDDPQCEGLCHRQQGIFVS